MTTSQKLDIKKQLEPLLSAAGFKRDPWGNWKLEVGPAPGYLVKVKFSANVIRYEKAHRDGNGWFRLASYTYQDFRALTMILGNFAISEKGNIRQSVEAMNRGPVNDKPSHRSSLSDALHPMRLTDVEFGFRCAEKGLNLEATLEEFRRITA